VDFHADSRCFRKFIQHGGDAAARGVANESRARCCREQIVDQSVQRRAVAFERRGQSHISARVQNCRTVIAQQSVHQNCIAWPHPAHAQLDAFTNDADPGRVDEQLVARSLVDDLRVAGHDHHTGRSGGARHRRRDLAQDVDVQSLFDDDRAAQIKRLRTAHCEIVDCAADSELSDVAAGEHQRMDDIGIRRHREAISIGSQVR
jgi:hypothetical protein